MQNQSNYSKICAPYQDALMNSLKEFIAINSVYDPSTVSDVNPFGEGVSKALDYIARLAKRDGFEVINHANKVVEILVGSGEKNITIMAHADVVPAGTGWEHDPFTLVDNKGVLTARGVADDKGPLLATYYALKALRDNKLLGNYQVRFLVGGNEENGSLCMEYFFHTLKKKQPTLGFSPDSDFPLIFAEKGILNFEVKKKINCPGLISFKGGLAFNAVIEECTAQCEINHELIAFIQEFYPDCKILTKDDVTSITFYGKAAHGSTPELGENAGLKAIKALGTFYKNHDLLSFYEKYKDFYGKGINAYNESNEMGKNSLNVGLVSLENNEFSATINFRYVDTCDNKNLLKDIKVASKPFSVKKTSTSPLLYYPKDSLLISTLLKAYQDETGDVESKPLAIGGGTYAKEANNVVAFGMQFPGFESYMHSNKEVTLKKDLFKAMDIYARAIVYLGEVLDANKI